MDLDRQDRGCYLETNSGDTGRVEKSSQEMGWRKCGKNGVQWAISPRAADMWGIVTEELWGGNLASKVTRTRFGQQVGGRGQFGEVREKTQGTSMRSDRP